MFNRNKSHLFIFLAGACWGLTGLCNRMLTSADLSQFQILFVRCFVTFLLITALLLFTDRSAFKIKLKDLWIFICLAVFSILMFGYSYFACMQETSLSVAVVLLYLAPVFVVLLSAPLFKEPITGKKIISLACVLVGACFSTGLFSGGLSITTKGLFFGVLAGLGYGLYSIFTRFGLDRGYKTTTITFYTFMLGSIVIGCFTDIPGIIAKTTTTSIALWEIAIGVVTCFIPYMLYTTGLKGTNNGRASIIASFEIVMTTLVSVLILAEPCSAQNIIGIVLVLGGIFIMNFQKPTPKSKPESSSAPQDEPPKLAQNE